MTMTEPDDSGDLSGQEPFGTSEFTINPNAFKDQYDMQDMLDGFKGTILLNHDKSITLIGDNYVDVRNAVYKLKKLNKEHDSKIGSADEPVVPEGAHPAPKEEHCDSSQQANSQSLDNPQKRSRHLVKNLTPGISNTENVNQEVSRSQSFPVDDHLWHYILFKHADEVGNITSRNLCEARVVPNSSGQKVSYSLEVSPSVDEFSKENDVNNLTENAIEEFAQLFQKVSVLPIMEESVTLPPELNRTDADDLKKTLEGMGFLLMPSGIHRLIGPLNYFEQAKNTVQEVIEGRQKRTQPVSVVKEKSNASLHEHKYKADQPLKFRSPKGLTVFVSQGDLVKQRVDAIVNPANGDLGHGGGAARAISDAAGYELNKECRDYIYHRGPLNTTWVMHTSAGRLQPNIRYVIHAVGPRKTNSTTDNALFQGVKRTIYNCLHYANTQLKIRSIAIPAISSGIFRVPLNVVAEASFAALTEFDNTLSSGTKYLNEVHFLNKDTPTVSGMRTAFAALLKKNFGTSVDPVDSIDKSGVVANYAAAFGRTLISPKSDKDCFIKAIAAALQNDFRSSLSFQDVEDMIKRELKENASYYKDFQLTPDESWTDKIRNIFSSPSLDSELNADLLLSAAASACKVEIVLVEVSTNGEPFERNFKPRFSSMKYADKNIYVSCYFSGEHSHFDALIKTTFSPHPEKSDHNSSVESSERNHSDNVVTSQPNKQSKTSDTLSNDFEYIDKKELENSSSNNGTSAKMDTKSDLNKKNDNNEDNMCIICMDTITDAKVLPCKHKFCRECIDNCFEKHQPKCPSCGKVFGIMKGNQPPGSMSHSETNYQHLPGYPGCGTIEIHYSFRSGTQQENHPNPGQPYRGTNRTAFLPGNKEGQEVLRLLKRAFDSGLVFTIGRSNTTGQENVVIWNDVHHKTSPHGQYGYPDPTYLKRVKEELAAKGIQ